ncbi:putative amidase-like protein [Melghirimyces profundicolus]|uniref:Putative amidase-like protein n=1 Tax=Melghirimyces profundicolus TaxID=1242148 RepID=A0A2T6C4Q7_9BACL|nr:amidase domain-containing protein [Melghirimyces profundicolus]PTX63298.1 putative amidase-like protein [Melghirimyces profundicolus]
MDSRKEHKKQDSKLKELLKNRKVVVASSLAVILLVGSLAYTGAFESGDRSVDSASQKQAHAPKTPTPEEYAKMSDEELVDNVSYYNEISLSKGQVKQKAPQAAKIVDQKAKDQNIKVDLDNQDYRDFVYSEAMGAGDNSSSQQKKQMIDYAKWVDKYENKLINDRIRELVKKAKKEGLTKEERMELISLLPFDLGPKVKPGTGKEKTGNEEPSKEGQQDNTGDDTQSGDSQQDSTNSGDTTESIKDNLEDIKPGDDTQSGEQQQDGTNSEDNTQSAEQQDGTNSEDNTQSGKQQQDGTNSEDNTQSGEQQQDGTNSEDNTQSAEQQDGTNSEDNTQSAEQQDGTNSEDNTQSGEQQQDGTNSEDNTQSGEQQQDGTNTEEPEQTLGTEANGYNRQKAVDYAYQWWNKRNPEYRSYKYDCTNFISQVVKTGGIKERKGGRWDWADYWYYNSEQPSMTWTVAHSFYRHMKLARGAQNTANIPDLKVGDIMSVDFAKDGDVDHSVIITKIENGLVYATYHSDDKKDNLVNEWFVKANVYAWKMETVKN